VAAPQIPMIVTLPPDPNADDPDDLDQVTPETRDQVVSFRAPRDQYERAKRRAQAGSFTHWGPSIVV
jgi:hypothetical protein